MSRAWDWRLLLSGGVKSGGILRGGGRWRQPVKARSPRARSRAKRARFQYSGGGHMAVRKLICGNWKMNGRKADAAALATDILARLKAGQARCDLMVCPPFVHLDAVAALAAGSKLAVGGQDCHAAASGAHTGDVSAPMLKDMGCSAVILGHSERRTNHGETDAQVRSKANAAHTAGLLTIVALGETL